MAEVPPELKKMKRFVREANKTQKVKPVLSYYCRLYAIQEAMKLPETSKTPATKAWMGEQMTILESTPADVSREEAQQQLNDFADNVFKVADSQDRSGNATKKTAAAFNTAYVFYEVMKQFGERNETTEKAAKYCLYKTTDILKALKEGRVPEPGPPGGFAEDDDDLDAEFKKLSGEFEGGGGGGDGDVPMNSAAAPPSQPSQPYQPPSGGMGGSAGMGGGGMGAYGGMGGGGGAPAAAQPNFPNAYNPHQPQPPSQPQSQPQPGLTGYPPYNAGPAQPRQQPRQQPPASNTSHTGGANYRKFESKVKACVEAEKVMKHAFSAMQFSDISTAITKLDEALGILRQFENK